MPLPSLDGRIFADVTADHAGHVDAGTRFTYHEERDGTIWGRYEGGHVRLGFLVGTRQGDALTFRYSHVTTDGETASGRCRSTIEALNDGRLRMREAWYWESHEGAGESTVEELTTS